LKAVRAAQANPTVDLMAKLKLVSSTLTPRESIRTPRSARSRRATPKSEQTRALILEAAVDCINQHGFHGTSMARVADLAGVTRGCLQYYFTTKEDVVIALAQHVARRNWEVYEAQASNPPAGRDLVEFAIDLVANPITDRYRVAHLELLTAARTTPVLRPVLQEVAQMVEAQAKRFTGHLFGNADLADTPQFRAARDLTALVNDWLFVQIFPDHREERIAEVLSALRIALHTLWRIPSLEGEADLVKPRVRVKAGTAMTPLP
jgi:AcrR family transcriptional regulator